jgi:hypothetical protein
MIGWRRKTIVSFPCSFFFIGPENI